MKSIWKSYLPVALRTDSPELSSDRARKPTTTTPLTGEGTPHGSERSLLTSSTTSTTSTRHAVKRANKWQTMKRIMCVLGALGVLAFASVLLFRFIKTDKFNHVIDWIQAHVIIGSVIYVACFTLCVILCFPSTAFELLAGYIFGFSLGLLLASTGKLLGSVLSFLIGRYLCRQQVQEYMERGHPILKALRSLLRKRQVMIVFLTRIAFFPIAMKNYGLSVLDVSFSVFVSAAFLTGLPFSFIWVYSGNAAQHLTTLLSNSGSAKSNHRTEEVLLVVGAASALLLLSLIGFYTRKHVLALAEEESLANARKEKDMETSRKSASGDEEDESQDDEIPRMSVV